MQQRLISAIKEYLASLNDDERIDALNAFRLAMHELSPFKAQPVDCVLWIRDEAVTTNNYNPNHLAAAEARLLQRSLERDGFTQPLVVSARGQQRYEIVDGAHRRQLCRSRPALQKSLHGYLPVACLAENSRASRLACTVRHNRARGRYHAGAASELIRELSGLGWTDSKIASELGMSAAEVQKMKQLNGLLELFSEPPVPSE